jgi:hypothetical protein
MQVVNLPMPDRFTASFQQTAAAVPQHAVVYVVLSNAYNFSAAGTIEVLTVIRHYAEPDQVDAERPHVGTIARSCARSR